VTVLALTLGFIGGALASNMGFKLNYGIVNAVNQLLYGSGVSMSVAKKADEVELAVNLDLANPSPRNSNMGFKLNLLSLPADGLDVDVGAAEAATMSNMGFKLNLLSLPAGGLEIEAPGGTICVVEYQDGDDRILVNGISIPISDL
jgi:hypothetical protein